MGSIGITFRYFLEPGSKIFTKSSKNVDFLIMILYNYIAGSNTLYSRVTELAFKCHDNGTGHDAAGRRFFLLRRSIILTSVKPQSTMSPVGCKRVSI